jgi:transcriptional regulator with XRE-family HTH domain
VRDRSSTAARSPEPFVHRCGAGARNCRRSTDHRGVATFDLPGALRRIRRLADVSQRELARACGLSQSVVAQVENGRRDLKVSTLAAAARLADLRLALLAADGSEVHGMRPDTVLDLAGRRFPAHLDTRRSDDVPWLYGPRRDRPPTSFTFHRDRDTRNSSRRRAGTPVDHHERRAGDSPAERVSARRREYLRRRAEERQRAFLAGEFRHVDDGFTCSCPPRCDELDDRSGKPVHAPGCACGCDLA